MTAGVRTLAEAPALERAMHRLHRSAWPPFLRDDAVRALWPRLYTDFPEFQLALHARGGRGGRVVAVGNTVPFPWSGTRPDRMDDVLARAFRGREGGAHPTALVALAAIVDPRERGKGWSSRLVAHPRATRPEDA